MLQRRTHGVEMDTDAVSPDCLKAAFIVAIDTLAQRVERAGDTINWNTLQMALHESAPETTRLTLRADIL
jgi:hypothetical protein